MFNVLLLATGSVKCTEDRHELIKITMTIFANHHELQPDHILSIVNYIQVLDKNI